MMKIILAVLLLVCIVAGSRIDEQFQEFKKTFNRSYKSPIEEAMRKDIFKNNLAEAKRLTELSEGKAQYGVTQFSDLSKLEFAHTYLMQKHSLNNVEGPELTITEKPDESKTWDWRYIRLGPEVEGYSSSCITPVYNQAQCGSCWAFSATEQIESMFCLQGHSGGKAESFSMQQIVSCDTQVYGCNGGDTPSAYDYVKSAGGIDSYASYPYTSGNGNTGTCKFKSSNVEAGVESWAFVGRSNEPAMLSYVQHTGPLSICVDAQTWQNYQGGVVQARTCGNQLDHCVQATGYNADYQGQKAWIVRNSWGTSWGYSGYLYVQYGANACGLTDCPTTVVTKTV